MINQYLQVTRKNSDVSLDSDAAKQRAQLINFYEHTFFVLRGTLLSAHNHCFPPPELTIVYTPFALTETVSLGAEEYLVYDQFLGQIFNRLNRLIVEDASIEQVDAYLAKLFATRLLVSDRLQESLDYAILHSALMLRISPRRRRRSATKRIYRQTAVQECFVMAHELVHSLQRGSPDEATKLRNDYCDGLMASAEELDAVWVGQEEDLMRNIAESTIEDAHRAYVRRYGSPDDEQAHQKARYEAVEKILKDHELPDREVASVNKLMTDPLLLEECVCDGIATALTVVWASQTAKLPLSISVPACYFALHHLRLLQYVDVLIDPERDNSESRSLAFLNETLTRFNIFRLGVYANMGLQDTESLNDMHARLTEANDAYARVVFDQLIFNFEHGATEALADLRDNGEESLINSVPDLEATIRMLCNLP